MPTYDSHTKRARGDQPWQNDPCTHTDNPNLCRKLGRKSYDEMVEAAERMEREHEEGETCEMRRARELGIDECYLHGTCCGEPAYEIDPEQHAG